MKLNPDCIRDLMIILENSTGVRTVSPYTFKMIDCDSLMAREDIKLKYTQNEVAYTLIQLADSGYICMEFKRLYEGIHFELGYILYVTPKGHEFISKITDEQRWQSKIKPLLNRVGSISLSIIESIASGVSSAFIDKLLSTQVLP